MNSSTDKTERTHQKLAVLKEHLKELGTLAVAFSGGVDSAFLLKTAQDVLGNNVIAITVHASSFPEREQKEAEDFCRENHIRHYICNADVLEIPRFSENPPDRCYFCKKELFQNILQVAESQHIPHIAEGSNLDDTGDYRPGLAAVAELHIKSPLKDAGLTKKEIRQLSKEMGLPTWEKPSFACLASRFAYGERITKEKLKMVEQAEQLLSDKGFQQYRVRIHGNMARIEVLPEEFERLLEETTRQEIVSCLKSFGFTYISMDLSGYRTGSMNEVL